MEYRDTVEQPSNTELQPCGICGRTFRPDALARHHKICEKNATKKRKVFDSTKYRTPEEAQQIASRPQATKQQPSKAKMPPTRQTKKPPQKETVKNENQAKPKPKANWREKHEELIKTIKRARGEDVEDNSKTEGEEPKKKVPSDYVECPGCGRNFHQRAAERHVPWCQQKKANTPKSPNEKNEAKEKLIARVKYRPPQGKSRLFSRKTKTAVSPAIEDTKKQVISREQGSHSSPPTLLDKRNAKNTRLDRINNNVPDAKLKRRSGSRSREREVKSQPELPRRSREREVKSQPELPQHIIKFKERFPNNKRNFDLEETLTAEQLRELLSVSRITDNCPKTVPGVRLSGGQLANRNNHNDNWGYRSSDVSRSSSSSGGSSNSWNKRLTDNSTLPEVSSSELPGTWMPKMCWNGDLDNSMGSSGSSSGSSSSGSLPPLSRESNEELVPLTFYCHQCNSKFPLIGAKYCCECGARRRGIGQISLNQTG